MTCALNERTVQLGGLHADRFPGEVIAGANEACLAHTTTQLRIVEDTHQAISHRFLKGARIERGPRAILLLVDRHEVAGLSIDDDVRDAAGRGADDGQAEGHRLEVNDAERLVHRRRDEDLRRGQDRRHLGLREHLGDEDDAGAASAQLGDEALDLCGNLGSVGSTGTQHKLNVIGQKLGGAQEVRKALLAGDAADEYNRATRRVNTMLGKHTGAQLLARLTLGGVPLVQVDTVVNDVHALGINAGVAAQNIVTHAVRDRDDRTRSLVGGLLHVGGQAVATTELLSHPRAQRLQRMRRNNVRDVAEKRRNVPSKVRVPGVGVDQVRPLARSGNLEVDAERAQRGVRSGQLRQICMSGHARVGSIGTWFARTVKRLDAQVIDQAAQDLGQFEHVDTGSSVDVRRVFTGKEINAHGGVLPTGATCETHRIRSHVTAGRNRDGVAIDRHL